MHTGRRVVAFSVAVLGICGAPVILCTGSWLLFFGVPGCGTERPANITATDLAGSYVTEDGGRLDLLPNGWFNASRLNVSDGFESRPPLSGRGTWALQPATSDFGDITLSHEYSQPGGYGDYLDISGSRADPWLYWYVGDHDSCDLYRFHRA